MFILILLLAIIAGTSSNLTYIDQLPEKEKQELLENIARRLLAEVKVQDDTKDVIKEGIEVTDEQLSKHDAFVKKIMKEEEDSFKQQTYRKTMMKNNSTKSNIGRVLPEKEVKAESYVDLTLRADKNRVKRDSGNKRKVFTMISPDDDSNTEQKSNESDADIQVKNFRKTIDSFDNTDILEKTEGGSIVDNSTNSTKEIPYQNNEGKLHQDTEIVLQDTLKVNYETPIDNEKLHAQIQKSIQSISKQKSEDNSSNATLPKKITMKPSDDDNYTEHNRIVLDVDIPVKNFSKTIDSIDNTAKLKKTDAGQKGKEKNLNQAQNDEKRLHRDIDIVLQDNLKNHDEISVENETLYTKMETTIQSTDIKRSESDSSTVTLLDKTGVIRNTENKSNNKEEKLLKVESDNHQENTKSASTHNLTKVKFSQPELFDALKETYEYITLAKSKNTKDIDKTRTRELKDSDMINIEIATVKTDLPNAVNNDINAKNIADPNKLNTLESRAEDLRKPSSTNNNKDTLRVNKKRKKAVKRKQKEDEDKEDEDDEDENDENDEDENDEDEDKESKKGGKISKFINSFVHIIKKIFKQKKDDIVKMYNLMNEIQNETNNESSSKEALREKKIATVYEVFEISPDKSPFVTVPTVKPRNVSDKKRPHLKLYQTLHKLQESDREPKPDFDKIKPEIQLDKSLLKRLQLHRETKNEFDKTQIDEKLLKFLQSNRATKHKTDKKKMESLKPQPAVEEQPYYVPVYNYIPKNAYFNPYNIYGRNTDSDDNDGYVINNDKVYKPPKMSQTKNPEAEEQSYYVPIYNFSPQNAFFNPKNYHAANIQNSDEKLDEYVDNYDLDENDNRIREKKPIEWQYYDDPYTRGQYEKQLKKKRPREKDDEETPNNTNISRSFLPLNYEGIPKTHEPKHNENNLDYYEKYYDEHGSNEEELLKTLTKYNNYSTNKKKQNLMQYINPITLIYYQNANENKQRTKNLIQKRNNPFQERVQMYKKPKTQFNYIYKKLRDFLIKYYDKIEVTQGEFDNKKLILRSANNEYVIPDEPKDRQMFKMVQELAKFLHEPEIVKLYFQMEKIWDEKKKRMEDEKEVERSKTNVEIDAFVEVIGDLVLENSDALKNYDWLGSAVDLQSAIKKMIDMVNSVRNHEDIHPSDLELLKYIVYLHAYVREEVSESTTWRRGLVLPRGKIPKRIITDPGLMAWHVRTMKPDYIPEQKLHQFEMFLEDLQAALYDLHTALKYIAMVTKYQNQKWFESLKQIHLEEKRKKLLEIILHLCTTRLFGIIEESAKKGLEDDFIEYAKQNEKEVEDTSDEFLFVLNLIEEIKRIK